jgi:hypothetical protein
MKDYVVITAFCLASAACALNAGDENAMPADATVIARSLPIAQEFQAQLKEQLVAALGAGGPETAVRVCKEVAPAIAADQSEASGAQVSRIAERHRNPAGAVRAELRTAYDELAAMPSVDGKPASRVVHTGEGDDARVVYLSAIPMAEQPCSVCHGANIDPALKDVIDGAYPGDTAIGFEPGELRGAMVVSWPREAFTAR